MPSILVVNLPVAVDLLVSLGVRSLLPLHVLAANGGGEALDLMRRRSGEIDLAIVNSDLADLTWLELTCELEKAGPETPIVVCLPRSKGARASRIERQGHRVLWHPILEKSLQDVVSRYLPLEDA